MLDVVPVYGMVGQQLKMLWILQEDTWSPFFASQQILVVS